MLFHLIKDEIAPVGTYSAAHGIGKCLKEDKENKKPLNKNSTETPPKKQINEVPNQ